MADDKMSVLRYKDGALRFVDVPRPTRPPADCGMSNEDLECMGCGQKLGCIKPGHCWAVEGKKALKD